MDRDVLDVIEREIDQEARARFHGSAVRQAVLLQYGDDPEIEPGDLWVRVLLDADGPEDYEPTLAAFLLTAGHADHGGNRGHPPGGHPVGPGPRPRTASLPAARCTEKRSRRAQERVLTG